MSRSRKATRMGTVKESGSTWHHKQSVRKGLAIDPSSARFTGGFVCAYGAVRCLGLGQARVRYCSAAFDGLRVLKRMLVR